MANLQEFLGTLKDDPNAAAAFQADPEGALNDAGFGSLAAADVEDALGLMHDDDPAVAVPPPTVHNPRQSDLNQAIDYLRSYVDTTESDASTAFGQGAIDAAGAGSLAVQDDSPSLVDSGVFFGGGGGSDSTADGTDQSSAEPVDDSFLDSNGDLDHQTDASGHVDHVVDVDLLF